MVVETALGAGLRVAAGPHAHIHSADGAFVPASGKRVAGEHSPQCLGIDSSPVQRGVEASPAAAMRRFGAQVDGGRDAIGAEEGVGEFEEGVGPAVEAFVE
jgi:hypothetical protein